MARYRLRKGAKHWIRKMDAENREVLERAPEGYELDLTSTQAEAWRDLFDPVLPDEKAQAKKGKD